MRRNVPKAIGLLVSAFFAVSLTQGAPPLTQGAAPGNPHALSARIQARSTVANPLAVAKEQDYDLIEIKGPDGSSAGALAWDITNSGMVSISFTVFDSLGNATGQDTLLFEDGMFKTIKHPGSAITSLIAANNGILFGNWGDLKTMEAGMYNPKTDQWTALPPVPNKPVNIGYRMNDAGVGVGSACEGAWPYLYNCVTWTWDSHRRAYRFLAYPGPEATESLGINNRGHVVGTAYLGAYAFGYLEYKDNLTKLPIPTEPSSAQDIDDAGTILVNSPYRCPDPSVQQGLLDRETLTPLPNWPGAPLTAYLGMNDRGDLTGVWFDESFIPHGFMAIRKHK
jgi:hypothetical protein